VTVTGFCVLGPVRALTAQGLLPVGGNRERALLALLLAAPGKVVSVGHLVEELWEGDPPPHAEANLRVHVSRLRKALGGTLLQTHPAGYRLEVPYLDLYELDGRISAARAQFRDGHLEAAATAFREALALWRGRPFADVVGPPSITAFAAALEERRLGLSEELIDVELARGRHATLVEELERLTGAHPLRERLWEQRILALYRSGRQAEALATYQVVRILLRDRYGLEPNPALRALERAVLSQDQSLTWRPVSAVRVPLPRALSLERPTPFVGRVLDLAVVRAAWARASDGHRRALLVAGEPGIGKSRLLAQAAQEIHAAGGLVLFGRCDEETLVPYQPLVEALHHYASHTPVAVLRELLGPDAAELTRLLPDLRGMLGPADIAVSGGERYRLFEAVNELISGVSARRLRSCLSLRTCSGWTRPARSCCLTCSGTHGSERCWCWPATVMSRSSRAIRWLRRWLTSAARRTVSAFAWKGSTPTRWRSL
jgi:DNA-binding SARP family transcriptional activator